MLAVSVFKSPTALNNTTAHRQSSTQKASRQHFTSFLCVHCCKCFSLVSSTQSKLHDSHYDVLEAKLLCSGDACSSARNTALCFSLSSAVVSVHLPCIPPFHCGLLKPTYICSDIASDARSLTLLMSTQQLLEYMTGLISNSSVQHL